MRKIWTLSLIIVGFALQAVSYLYWAAPLGTPTNPSFSNPVVPFAAGYFVLGVMLVFISAVGYELMPEEK